MTDHSTAFIVMGHEHYSSWPVLAFLDRGSADLHADMLQRKFAELKVVTETDREQALKRVAEGVTIEPDPEYEADSRAQHAMKVLGLDPRAGCCINLNWDVVEVELRLPAWRPATDQDRRDFAIRALERVRESLIGEKPDVLAAAMGVTAALANLGQPDEATRPDHVAGMEQMVAVATLAAAAKVSARADLLRSGNRKKAATELDMLARDLADEARPVLNPGTKERP